jgi:predicted RNA-binding Zn-ribbon protein involved in translation (DUF1610 family)
METIELMCPHCGELIDFDLTEEDRGEVEFDCPECGAECRMTVERDEFGDPQVKVEKVETAE